MEFWVFMVIDGAARPLLVWVVVETFTPPLLPYVWLLTLVTALWLLVE